MRRTLDTSRPTTVPWPPILFAAAAAAAYILDQSYPLPWPGLDDRPAQIAGYALGLAGAALSVWGMVTLIRAHTTYLPNRAADRLVTEGAFSFRRNPIYMAEVFIFLGLAQVTYNIWLALMAPVFAAGILLLSILPEERHLEARFGDEYREYKARTRRWF